MSYWHITAPCDLATEVKSQGSHRTVATGFITPLETASFPTCDLL